MVARCVSSKLSQQRSAHMAGVPDQYSRPRKCQHTVAHGRVATQGPGSKQSAHMAGVPHLYPSPRHIECQHTVLHVAYVTWQGCHSSTRLKAVSTHGRRARSILVRAIPKTPAGMASLPRLCCSSKNSTPKADMACAPYLSKLRVWPAIPCGQHLTQHS